jgi:L-aminopeptidase/D-esterase-like protein
LKQLKKLAHIQKDNDMFNAITDVKGIKVGHASNFKGYTGCTVILCEDGATGGIDVRGSAAGTRQTDSLQSQHLVEEVHAVLISGGSAFGLNAAGGVLDYLEERGKGFQTSVTKVPIVPTAIIYDLSFGDYRVRPTPDMGYNACKDASAGKVEEGSIGVGTGATIGKLYGMEQAMKGGFGTASRKLPNGLIVGAAVAVNAFGDVVNNEDGTIIAGARDSEKGYGFVNSFEHIKKGIESKEEFFQETTLGVVATNANLTKRQAIKIAQMAHTGFAKAISPIHLTSDGDLVIALSTRKINADLNIVGLLAEEAIAEAVKRAIIAADGFGIMPAYKDIPKNRGL